MKDVLVTLNSLLASLVFLLGMLLLMLLYSAPILAVGGLTVLGRRTPRGARRVYGVAAVVGMVTAYGLTFHYEYMANANTRVCGWPIPRVIFQRADATANWEDFVGAISFLAYPVNLALFLAPVAVGLLIWRWWPGRRSTIGGEGKSV